MNTTPEPINPICSDSNAFFARFATWIIRHRFSVLALNLGVTIFFLAYAPSMVTDTSYKALQVVDSEGQRVQDLLEDAFGADAGYVVLVEGDVFSLPYLNRLKALHGELAGMDIELPSLGLRDGVARQDSNPGASEDGFGDFGDEGAEAWGEEGGATVVDEITSLINVRDTRSRAGGLEVGGLLDTWPSPEDLPEVRSYALAQPAIVGNFVSKNGRYSVLYLRTDFLDAADQAKVDGEIRRIGKRHEADGFSLQYTGMAAVNGEFQRLMLSAVGLCYALSIALMVGLLTWTFRHAIGVIAPMLVVVQSLAWVIGAMAMSGTPMTLITTILPNFLTCVGIGDSVHIMTTYRAARGRGVPHTSAIVESISGTARPVIFTSITTAVGLLSFMFADLRAITHLGMFGAFGVLAAMVQSLVLVPVMLSFAPTAKLGAKHSYRATGLDDGWVGRLLRACLRLSAPGGEGGTDMGARNRVLFAVVVLVVVGAGAASVLRVHYDPISWLPKDSETSKAFAVMDAHLGGSGGLQLLVEPREEGGIRELDTLERLAKLERHILDYRNEQGQPVPISTVGLLGVVRESWWALHGKSADTYVLPDSDRGVSDVLTMFENSGPEHLKRVTTVDGSASVLGMGMLHVPSSEYVPLLRYIEQGIEAFVGDAARVQVTGTMRQMIESDHALVQDMIRSFLIALSAITVLMVWMLGDLRLGLIAMVPNLLPLVAVLAFMVAMGIGVDMSNLLVASIGIGIAVDDTIHFLHHFGAAYRRHGNREQAIEEAAGRAGSSIINTSVVLFGGFIIFMVAPLQNLVVFGELIGVTVVAALFIDLVFTPALLRLVYPGQVAASTK